MERALDRPWIIAHRGASAPRRENTISAFRHARAVGADAVELDVRRTADGSLVVHHDARAGDLGPIIGIEAADLADRAPWIPSLPAAIEACAGMWINIEVKNSPVDPDWDPDDETVEAVVALVADRGIADRILLSSFNLRSVRRAGELMPALRTGWLLDRGLDPVGAAAAVPDIGLGALHPHAGSLEGPHAAEAVRAAGEAGLLLVTWTVDDPHEIRRLAAAGVDGIITNVPAAAISALDDGDRDRG